MPWWPGLCPFKAWGRQWGDHLDCVAVQRLAGSETCTSFWIAPYALKTQKNHNRIWFCEDKAKVVAIMMMSISAKTDAGFPKLPGTSPCTMTWSRQSSYRLLYISAKSYSGSNSSKEFENGCYTHTPRSKHHLLRLDINRILLLSLLILMSLSRQGCGHAILLPPDY